MRSSGWGDVVSSPCAPATPCIATPLSPSTHSLFFEIPPAHIQLWVATSNGAGGLISDGSSRFGFRGPKYLRYEFWVSVNMILLICWNLYMAHRTPTLPTLRKHQIQVRGKQNSLSEKGTFFRNDNQDVSFSNEDERLKLKITRNHLWNISPHQIQRRFFYNRL